MNLAALCISSTSWKPGWTVASRLAEAGKKMRARAVTESPLMRVQIALIRGQDNPRQLDERAVSALTESIGAIGLIQPITVRQVSANGGTGVAWKLISGMHRVEACRRLGLEEIDAIVMEGRSYLETELIEIDENLCRAELSPAQRAAAIKRRKQIWDALHPENSGPSCPTIPRGRGRPGEFAADTATVTGESKRDINRHLSRADALGDDLSAVTGTSLDKGVELDALKALPEPERRDLIARAQSGEVVSARKPMARIRLEIEYRDNQEGAELIAQAILKKDPVLADALYGRLGDLLGGALRCRRRITNIRSKNQRKPVFDHPGTPFLRKWLNAMERIAITLAEVEIRKCDEIVQRFEEDMDWESDVLATQFERCGEVIEAMHKIHLKYGKKSKPKLSIVSGGK